jgi:hypothetical protein
MSQPTRARLNNNDLQPVERRRCQRTPQNTALSAKTRHPARPATDVDNNPARRVTSSPWPHRGVARVQRSASVISSAQFSAAATQRPSRVVVPACPVGSTALYGRPASRTSPARPRPRPVRQACDLPRARLASCRSQPETWARSDCGHKLARRGARPMASRGPMSARLPSEPSSASRGVRLCPGRRLDRRQRTTAERVGLGSPLGSARRPGCRSGSFRSRSWLVRPAHALTGTLRAPVRTLLRRLLRGD